MGAVRTVRRFQGLRALVIGDAMLDSYLEGDAARLCTEGPVPVVRQTSEEHLPGGAANSAANLRSLGADVVFLGVIGQDVAGGRLRQVLQARGIDDGWLVVAQEASTLQKLRILANEQYVVRYDSGETRLLSQETRRTLLDRLERALAECDVVVVSDYRYGVLSDELIERLRMLRERRTIPLVVDSKDLRHFSRAHATVVTPNHLEARLAVDPHGPTSTNPRPEQVERMGEGLLALLDCDCVLVTMGKDGAMLTERSGRSTYLPAHPVAEANDVGAGDSFTATLALALGAGAEIIDAARIGIDAAAIAVGRRRTASVSQQELLQRVSLTDGPTQHSAAELAVLLEEDRQRGRTIVFTNGVWDILHAGHIHFLRRARELGDILVVGVNTDRSVRRLKGPNRPINSERDRMALVAALDGVDHVIPFDEDDPAATIRALRPHIHAKGGDYEGAPLPEREAVEEVGGRLVILPLHGALSTTGMIDRIMALALEGPSR